MEAEIMQPEVDTTKAQAFAGRVCTALALLFAFFEYEQCGWFRRFAHRECMSARRGAELVSSASGSASGWATRSRALGRSSTPSRLPLVKS